MSLRDQLLAKGLASKKDAQRVERELKEQLRTEQANQKRKSVLEAEQAARKAEEERQLVEQRRIERAERKARKDAAERALQVRNLVVGNTLRPGRGQPFWHRSLDGKELLRVEVSTGMAYQLRCGEAGIAALVRQGRIEYLVVTRKAATRLHEVAPEHLVFFVHDVTGISEPDLRFLERQWDTDLAAHRASDADLERFRGA